MPNYAMDPGWTGGWAAFGNSLARSGGNIASMIWERRMAERRHKQLMDQIKASNPETIADPVTSPEAEEVTGSPRRETNFNANQSETLSPKDTVFSNIAKVKSQRDSLSVPDPLKADFLKKILGNREDAIFGAGSEEGRLQNEAEQPAYRLRPGDPEYDLQNEAEQPAPGYRMQPGTPEYDIQNQAEGEIDEFDKILKSTDAFTREYIVYHPKAMQDLKANPELRKKLLSSPESIAQWAKEHFKASGGKW